MLNHDQNNVNVDLEEDKNKVGEDITSQNKPEEGAPEQEVSTITPEEVTPQEPEQEAEAPETSSEAETAAEEAPVAETPEPEAPAAEEVTPEPEPVETPAESGGEKELEEPKAPATQEEMDRQAMINMYDKYTVSLERGEVIEGTVVDVTDKDVVVAIGYKSDGVIPISEFSYGGIPEIDSTIKVFIERVDDGEGKLELSKKKADFIKNIEKIKQAFDAGTILPGVVRRRVKGGMIVEVIGIEAFLPGSHIGVRPMPNLDQYIGKEMGFKVLSLDDNHKNIIVSRKLVLEAEQAEKRKELLATIEVGAELDGEVKNITNYGAFIDLGGIDGLLHITDMSWGKINHPSEMLSIGDKVKVKVITFEPETERISLGLKQLVPHPWETIELKFPEGTRITGRVMSVRSFGAFVELEPGVEGLVHISEMSWTRKISDARKFVKVGDVIDAIVLELDTEEQRISLGMKQMDPNPWLTIEDRYPIGTVLNRKIKSITAFGAFVEIEDGIDGLIHISDISWTKRVYHPREVYTKGQEVEAVILSIDRALHRIALGVKQLNPDPWQYLHELLPVNTEVLGKITKLIPKGVLVDIETEKEVVEGFVPISHLAIPKLDNCEDAFVEGERIPLKVIELDTDNRRLILSAKAFFYSRDPKLHEEYVAIHEAVMREKLALIQKRKQEKAQREKQRKERMKKKKEEAKRLEEEQKQQEAAAAAAAEEAPATEAPEPEVVEPVAEAPVEETPVEEVAVEEAPAEEAPAEEEPVEEAPVEETPEPEAEAPVEEAPAEEAPAEEPVAEEAPVEEAPVEETPAEETPAEEAPAPEPEVAEPVKTPAEVTEEAAEVPQEPEAEVPTLEEETQE